jgi:hypothetical protein
MSVPMTSSSPSQFTGISTTASIAREMMISLVYAAW